MLVAGRDHDMLMVALVFRLYHKDLSERAAYKTAEGPFGDFSPLCGAEIAGILESGGLACLCVNGNRGAVWKAARRASEQGCATLVQVQESHLADEPLWHLLHDPLNGRIGTLMMHPTPGEAIMADDIADCFLGEAVIVQQSVPGFRGKWEAVTHK